MSAIISDCGRFRYSLSRRWAQGSASALWIMLNPSTADATIDDPTIRRCISFTKAWGRDSLTVCNLYALRATDPGELWACDDPVGPENDRHLMNAPGDVVVCAWGVNAKPARAAAVIAMLKGSAPLVCLGTTKDGFPRHPLYVAGSTPLEAYRG